MRLQTQIEEAKNQLEKVQVKIKDLEDDPAAGPVRLALKRQRAELTGEIVNINQRMIEEEVASDNPRAVPAVRFEFSIST